jgi:hypothetical protein
MRMRTLFLLAALAAAPVPAAVADVLAPYVVDGDAIPEPIGNARGEPGRGRALVLARELLALSRRSGSRHPVRG